MKAPAHFACVCGQVIKEATINAVEHATIKTTFNCACGRVYKNVYLHIGGTITIGGDTKLSGSRLIGRTE